MICNTCSKSVPNDSEFCPFCGNKIIAVIPQNEATTSLHLYSTTSLLNRAFLIIEEGDFEKASNYIEHILNCEPENAEAYLAHLFIDLKVKSMDDLSNLKESFSENINYKRVLKFASEGLKEKLIKISTIVDENIEKSGYSHAVELYQRAKANNSNHSAKEKGYREALSLLLNNPNYKDAPAMIDDIQNYLNEEEDRNAINVGIFLTILVSIGAIIIILLAK